MSWFKEKLCGQCSRYRDEIVKLEHEVQDFKIKYVKALESSTLHKSWYDEIKEDYWGHQKNNRRLKIEFEGMQAQVKSVLEVNKLLMDQLSLYELYAAVKTKEKE